MMEQDERDLGAYFILTIGALAFVMLYIWQSVEVTKIKLEYKKMLKSQEQLVKEHDRVLFEIERLRYAGVSENDAEKRGMRRMIPSDFERVEVK